MARPLMKYGIGQLEEMFSRGKADPEVLKQLEYEPRHRKVSRAVTLLAEVQAAMYLAPPVGVPQPLAALHPAPQQRPLWERPAAPPATLATQSEVSHRPETPSRSPVTPASVEPSNPPALAMPLDSAYKLLKATVASTWESIEQTRRQIVQQTHPERLRSMSADRRTQALAEAKRINAAYAMLSQARCDQRHTL